MTFRHNLFSLLILFIAFSTLKADIKGTIIDSESNEPVIGARVSVKNTLLGDISDKSGKFLIRTELDAQQIEIKSPGYQQYTSKLSNDTSVTIKLSRISYKSDELVISANKKVESIQDVPISLSIISKEEFSIRNITSLENALKYVPGLEVNQDNVSIRGSSGFSFGIGSRAIFLQDGFPLLSADNNDIKFDIVPILFINRVEVIKGAGSALYGTSALGGVINVITSEPSKNPLFRARLYSGVYDRTKYEQWNWSDDPLVNKGLDLGYSQSFGNYGLLANVSLIGKDSYRKYDKSQRISLFLKQLYRFDEKTNLEFTANYSTSKSDDWVFWNSLDSALIPPTDTDQSIEFLSKQLSLSSQFKHIINDNSLFNIKLGLFNTFFSNQLEDIESGLRESAGNTVFFEAQYSNNLDKENSLIAGVESRINLVNSQTYGNNSQSLIGAFAQLENTNIENLIATVGIRVDKEFVDSIETTLQVSPKIGLNYTLSDKLRLRSSYGRGFRAASIAERFASVNFQGIEVAANPNLKSESSYSYELGASYDILNSDNYLNLDIAGFYNKFDDLIEPTFETKTATVIKFKNIVEAEISGIEATLNYKFKDIVNFKSSITYLNPRDIVRNEDLKYRSNYLWYNSLNFKLLPFEIQLDYRYKSKFREIDERLGLAVNDYDLKIDAHILDMGLAVYSDIFDTKSKFTLSLKNALNYYYLEMVGNMAPIRFLNFQIETEL